MNKNCVFTIVAKNYIGLGQILGKTLHRYNPEIDFRIIVADEFDEEIELPENVVIAKNILPYNKEEWLDMSFKYDLTEFCTSIKPSSFYWLFKLGYQSVVYFDPDIFIFSQINMIFSDLEKYDIVLTPQIDGIHIQYCGEHPEWLMNVNGIFNLGFVGIRNSPKTKIVLSWWAERLKDQCFWDRSLGQFTDQKWMDWIPGLLGSENVKIIRNLGMNLAPWNFFERKIEKGKDGRFYVSFREEDSHERRKDLLVFVHYSGYDYNKLKQGIVEHKRMSLHNYPDLKEAINLYGDAIKEEAQTFDQFIDQNYSYQTYSNGDQINGFHRRLYHGIRQEKRLQINPFLAEKDSFYYQLKKKGMINNMLSSTITKNSISGLDKKKKLENFLFKLIYKVLGFQKYVPFVKSLYLYCRPEEHIFLIEEDKIKL